MLFLNDYFSKGGNPATLYDSVWTKILSLPPTTTLWPAHDYNGRTATSVEEESAFNPRLTKSKSDFCALMHERFDGSSYPGAIDASLPANMVCGVYEPNAEGEVTWDIATGTPVPHPDGFVWVPRDEAAK